MNLNIIILLGGKGERFKNEGFLEPKPFIKVFDSYIIEYLLKNLTIKEQDNVYIIYNKNVEEKYIQILFEKYSFINFINIEKITVGPTQTLLLGLETIVTQTPHQKTILLDCDTFYTHDILETFRNSQHGLVFYTKKEDNQYKPKYSYITMTNNNFIQEIMEKKIISEHANTGIYSFMDIKQLYQYSKKVIDNKIYVNNEPYISCIISEMVKDQILFKGSFIDNQYVFGFNTPMELQYFKSNRLSFLFDLDGTLVITDDIYFKVWSQIFQSFNLELTIQIFKTFIQGHNDRHVLDTLLYGVQNITLKELSEWKDSLFLENINSIQIIEGVYSFIQTIKKQAHKICIVTNCNQKVAVEILKILDIYKDIDYLISSGETKLAKPHPDPYLLALSKLNMESRQAIIFEDSKTGVASAVATVPKQIIGLETSFSKEILLQLGVSKTIQNYACSIKEILMENTATLKIAQCIKNSLHNFNITSVELDNEKLKGGFIANVLSCTMNTPESSHYIIVKLENQDESSSMKLFAQQLKLYEREYYFYESVSKYVKIPIAMYFGTFMNDNYQTQGIILENLFKKGNFKAGIDLNELPIEVSLHLIKHVANMHIQFWGVDIKSFLPKIVDYQNDIFKNFQSNMMERWDTFKCKWKFMLSPQILELLENTIYNFQEVIKNVSTGPLTLLHGDFKSANIFYNLDDSYSPIFVDWQHMAMGKGIQDIIFFLIESFSISNIKLYYPIFKYYYYNLLLKNNINYQWTDYEKDIENAIMHIPLYTAVWFGTLSDYELIDKNFPYFFIQKLQCLLQIIYRINPKLPE